MLKFFFHRASPVVRLMEMIGVLNSILYLRVTLPHMHPTTGLFLFLLACYLFVRACDVIDWYPHEEKPSKGKKEIGIRVHFQKALVPSSYLLAITSFFCLLELPLLTPLVVALADFMMLVIVPVNGILVYFHFNDKDSLPINYFSMNKYLKKNAETS